MNFWPEIIEGRCFNGENLVFHRHSTVFNTTRSAGQLDQFLRIPSRSFTGRRVERLLGLFAHLLPLQGILRRPLLVWHIK